MRNIKQKFILGAAMTGLAVGTAACSENQITSNSTNPHTPLNGTTEQCYYAPITSLDVPSQFANQILNAELTKGNPDDRVIVLHANQPNTGIDTNSLEVHAPTGALYRINPNGRPDKKAEFIAVYNDSDRPFPYDQMNESQYCMEQAIRDALKLEAQNKQPQRYGYTYEP